MHYLKITYGLLLCSTALCFSMNSFQKHARDTNTKSLIFADLPAEIKLHIFAYLFAHISQQLPEKLVPNTDLITEPIIITPYRILHNTVTLNRLKDYIQTSTPVDLPGILKPCTLRDACKVLITVAQTNKEFYHCLLHNRELLYNLVKQFYPNIPQDLDKALLYCAVHNNRPGVKLLLNAGANVNAQEPTYPFLIRDMWYTTGQCALVRKENYESELLNLPSLQNLVQHSQDTFSIITLLLAAGARTDLTTEQGATALMCAVCQRPEGMRLDSKSQDFIKRGYAHATALMLAAKLNKAHIVEILLQTNAAVDTKDAHGKNALMHAAVNNSLEALDILLTKATKEIINAQDKYGKTALMYAISNINNVMVKRLLDAGADTTLKNDEGQAALDLALKSVKDMDRGLCSHPKTREELGLYEDHEIVKLLMDQSLKA